MKAAVIELKGLNFNRFTSASRQSQAKKEDAKELLHRIEALKYRVTNLRLQCEELRTNLNEKSNETTLCSECGQQIEISKALVFRGAAETRAFCKKCFDEMWE